MNSYPVELLVQHAPLMFVAGLDTPSSKQDPFYTLITRLREALTTRPKGLVWDRHRSTAVNILLVDKTIRLPPRKVATATDHNSQIVPHSPLSPLIPTSPLYPDGLIAPIWVRKHLELVPSIYVLFLRLWEAPPPLSPLEGRESELEEERFNDQELAAELSARKKTLAERGIKLTAVLLASRRLLDDPNLDTRLTFLRRQSSLDARAALFVLSPVDDAELQEFVKSLTDALREPSIEYYNAHSKRVRRKRNRHAGSAYSGFQSGPVATSRAVPLRPIGWTVRYEYKMGTFAEFRNEEEVARKHYEDCWSALTDMFGSTTVLPPRTKRWAEAKVLADTVSIKIYKMYLYNNEHSLALSCFNRHINKFCDLSKGWGIGEDTFEYWSWLARQYRILAEMMEIALRAGLRLPSQGKPDGHPLPLPNEPIPSPGIAPSTRLQHPGYYYFQASRCTQERLNCFTRISEAEKLNPTAVSQSTAFINEQKVDHWALILELYSKAYELFKKYAAGQSRLTFFIAVQIATTYHKSGKHELAIKFFERIVKVYRKERWGKILRPLITMWYDSARQIGKTETCVKLLIQMIALGVSPETEGTSLVEDLLAILESSKPEPETMPMTIDLSPAEQLLLANVVFYGPETFVGTPFPFQIQLFTPTWAHIEALPFDLMSINFSGDRPPMHIKHSSTTATDQLVEVIGNIGSHSTETTGCLRFQPGRTKVFSGTISSDAALELSIKRISLELKIGEWDICINVDPSVFNNPPIWYYSAEKTISLRRQSANSIVILPTIHQLDLEVSHSGIALVNEQYPLVITVNNKDTRSFDTYMDILLQPAENDTVNYISVNGEKSSGLISGINLGRLEPGQEIKKTIYLTATNDAGRLVADISIQSRVITEEDTQPADEREFLRTVTIETLEPFQLSSKIVYSQSREAPRLLESILNLEHEEEFSVNACIDIDLESTTICGMEIEGIRIISSDAVTSKLTSSSLDFSQSEFPSKWKPGTVYSISLLAKTAPIDDEDEFAENPVVPAPATIEVVWKRSANDALSTTTTLTLPELKPPTLGTVVLLEPPTIARLHVPFTLPVRIRNNDSRNSAELSLLLEPSEGFVVAGLRSGSLPVLLPGTEQSLLFNLIPIMAGTTKLPMFRITQRLPDRSHGSSSRTSIDAEVRQAGGQAVDVVDVRLHEMDEAGKNVKFFVQEGDLISEMGEEWMSVLVW